MTKRCEGWVFVGLGVLVAIMIMVGACKDRSSGNATEMLPSELRPEIGQQWIGLHGGKAGEKDFHLVQVDGGQFITLTSEIGPPVSRFAISPDKSRVVYSCPNDLCLMNVETGQEERLVDVSEQIPGAMSTAAPAFSPDGRQVLFTVGSSSGIDLYTVDIDGSDLKQVGDGVYSHYASYSPDGRQVIFECEGSRGVPTQICVMNADGSESRRLTDANMVYAAARFTPDGRHIVFSARKFNFVLEFFGWGDSSRIYAMNTDGSELRQLVSDEWSVVRVISADGKELVYQVNDEDTGDIRGIYVVNIDGTNKRWLGDDWWDVARRGGGLAE
jgi:Tol biopolymer transport system component